jgi:hypothetical protein
MPSGPQGPITDAAPDQGLEATEPGSNFYNTFAKDPTANYVPSGARRRVGTGVAVQEPGAEEPMGLLPRSGSVIPMTGSQMQQALASYSPGSLGARLATGYEQIFGRSIDPAGAEYYMNRFANQNLDQAAINRYLSGGAQGEDVEAAQDYLLSLTGGRPDYEARMAQGRSAQYMQPIYHGTYQDYMPQQPAPQMDYFSPGFNPFSYTSPGAQSFAQYGGYNPFAAGAVNPYAARMQPNRPVGEGVAVENQVGADARGKMAASMPNANPYLTPYLQAYARDGGVGS